MNIWDILILLIVALIVGGSLYMIKRKGAKQCSCGCAACKSAGKRQKP